MQCCPMRKGQKPDACAQDAAHRHHCPHLHGMAHASCLMGQADRGGLCRCGMRRTPPNDIVVHIRMLDRTAQLQQEAVGVLGINLIHAAFYGGDDTAAIISKLLEELNRSRIEARACLPTQCSA